jgi:hypothetical protein
VLVERQSFPDHPNPNPNPKAQPNMAENTGRGLSALAPRQQKNTKCQITGKYPLILS